MRRLYQKRRNVLYRGLRKLGLKMKKPPASFYLWCESDRPHLGSFSSLLLEKAAVVCTPGNGFGAHGEGYVRFALTGRRRAARGGRRPHGGARVNLPPHLSVRDGHLLHQAGTTRSRSRPSTARRST